MDAPRPWTRGSPAGPSLLPPRPSQLRPSRSATNLMTTAHRPQEQGVVDDRGDYLVDFVVDELPTPIGPHAGLLVPQAHGQHREQQVRRVKSSSALNTSAGSESAKPKDESKWKAALGEAQYFAGGLISHPSESTRHYSIIRHSSALVWYRGPKTSVSITILSDSPLPGTRTLWLQQKGFSGNMGMSLKALVGTTNSWIEVTPAMKAAPENIAEGDERGIQRDLKRFAKKASGKTKSHIPRETHVVRIPAAAEDGYFRLVLCCGEDSKKVLCGSPVFRVASTSTDMSVARGASLSTMPLEVGVKVASTVGQQVAKRYAGVAGAVVQSRAARAIPNAAVKKVAQAAYARSGVGTAVQESWKAGKAGRYDPLVQISSVVDPLAVVGSDEGPEKPFPLPFDGKVVEGTGWSSHTLGISTANLREVPDEIKMRLKGTFAAWACILPKPGIEGLSHDWHEAIVAIAPFRNAVPGIVIKNKVAVHILSDDLADANFIGARVKVILMAYLHPPNTDDDPDELVKEHAQDVMTTLGSLDRENWGPTETLSTMRTLRSERSFTERLNGATSKVQNGVDRIPIHLAGVRSESGTMRDQVYGIGGLWIPR